MFSTIGNIFSGEQKPREAENSDTRLDIKRHDPDQERKKKDDSSEDDVNAFLKEDSATVSTDSLFVFLENFLEAQLQKQARNASNNGLISSSHTSLNEPVNEPEAQNLHVNVHSQPTTNKAQTDQTFSQRAASPSLRNDAGRAAYAYAHAAEVSAQKIIQRNLTHSALKEGDNNELLSDHNEELMDIENQDVRLIHGLLNDLKFLQEKNITSLHIEREDTFLMSIKEAIDTAKQQLIS